MVKVKIEVEFEIDDMWGANSSDQEEREWFWNETMPNSVILWHSNEVGDTIAETTLFTVKEIKIK